MLRRLGEPSYGANLPIAGCVLLNMKQKQVPNNRYAEFASAIDRAEDADAAYRSGRRKKSDRKTLQLCSQVADTLSLVLSGDEGDEVLGELQVVSVVPAPDATQLLVVLAPTLANGPSETVINARLAESASRLRGEVAAAITRRRAPKLLFQLVNRPLVETSPKR